MKNNYPHLPPQQEINIHDAATLIQEWTGDTIIWANLFDQQGILHLYRGEDKEKLPYYCLSRIGNVCEFKNRRGAYFRLPKADCRNIILFKQLFRISSNKGMSFKPLKALTIFSGFDYRVVIFNHDNTFGEGSCSCYYIPKDEGVTIVGQWNLRKQTLYLWNVDKDIPHGLFCGDDEIAIPYNTTEKDVKHIVDIILQYAKDPTETIFF